MLSTRQEAAEKYAQAIFDLAEEENALAKVKEDVNFFLEVFTKNEKLIDFLDNPFGDKQARRSVVAGIFKNNVESISLNFILLLVEKKLEKLLPLIVKHFNKLVHEKEGTVEVRITTARELSSSEYEKITKRLSEMVKKPVALNKHVDPGIIGGMVVQIGDRLVNGSIDRKLKDIGYLMKNAVTDDAKGANIV